MGTIHGFCASSQASATCAGVASLRAAKARSTSTKARFAFSASGVKRGKVARKSEGSKVVVVSIFPVRKPWPSGLHGTKPMPSSSHMATTPADGLRPRLGEAEVPHLALPDQLLHRARHVLDRHARVHAVLVEKVDRFDAEALQHPLGRGPDVLGTAVQAAPALPRLGVDVPSENLVAITTRSRTCARASPTSTSLVNGP
jgi:hypothetical protein